MVMHHPHTPKLFQRYVNRKTCQAKKAAREAVLQQPKRWLAGLLQDPLWDAQPLPRWQAVTQTPLQRLVAQVQIGDMIAFGGVAPFSRIIQWVTRSEVSHVAVVARREEDGCVTLIEANQGGTFNGVQTIDLEEKCRGYVGDIWWLPLEPQKIRPRFFAVMPAFERYLETQLGKPYDMFQAALSAIDPLGTPRENKNPHHDYTQEDASRFFCSELVSAAYQHVGLLDARYDPTELTPADCIRLPLFQLPAYKLA
jgi:hypothetical protein